jgi:hypothetical protein
MSEAVPARRSALRHAGVVPHEIPSYAKASEGYPPVAKSAGALIFDHMND